MKRIILEEPALRDLRHLATEIYPLVREPGAKPGERLLAEELASTAWCRLRDCGPVHDGYNGYFRTLTNGQVQCLNFDQLEGAKPGRVISVYDDGAWPLWLCLQSAEACSERQYADVLAASQACSHLSAAYRQAGFRWERAEAQLRAEGLLPVRVLAPPSSAGGARYVAEVLLGTDYEPALRETLAWYGGYLLGHRDGGAGACYYTLSLESVNDLFQVGTMLVLQHYADMAERKGAGRG